jgi:hypothetical protein
MTQQYVMLTCGLQKTLCESSFPFISRLHRSFILLRRHKQQGKKGEIKVKEKRIVKEYKKHVITVEKILRQISQGGKMSSFYSLVLENFSKRVRNKITKIYNKEDDKRDEDDENVLPLK